jgi:ribosomal-protein-alanine N-acetyltransferase
MPGDPAPLGPGDAPRLAALHALAFDRPWSAGEIAALMDSPGVLVLAAPGGFVMMRAAAGEAEVVTLAVDPAFRRRGLGAALTRAGLAAALALGAEEAFLEVAQDNIAAIGLYRSLGFETVGRRPGYYPRIGEPAADALVMRLSLNR